MTGLILDHIPLAVPPPRGIDDAPLAWKPRLDGVAIHVRPSVIHPLAPLLERSMRRCAREFGAVTTSPSDADVGFLRDAGMAPWGSELTIEFGIWDVVRDRTATLVVEASYKQAGQPYTAPLVIAKQRADDYSPVIAVESAAVEVVECAARIWSRRP